MKHKRYSRSGVRISLSWTDQVLGVGLLILALACYRLIAHRTILQNVSILVTYLFGTGLIIHPLYNPKRLLKSFLIGTAVIVVAGTVAAAVIYTKDHSVTTHPFKHQQPVVT